MRERAVVRPTSEPCSTFLRAFQVVGAAVYMFDGLIYAALTAGSYASLRPKVAGA